MLDGLTVVREAFARTVRLAATANRRPSVLRALVSDEDLAALAEIEGATSARLLAEEHGAGTLEQSELVFGLPHGRFINAAFAYSRPQQLNRFNGPDRGAWYAALDVHTCLEEVSFHMAGFLGDAGSYRAVVEYVELHASLAGEYLDLRLNPDHPSLDPEPASGYPAGNALADAVRARGLNGVIYPSVRAPGGTCFVALWPHAVQSVAQGAFWRMEWAGTPAPYISAI